MSTSGLFSGGTLGNMTLGISSFARIGHGITRTIKPEANNKGRSEEYGEKS